MNIGVQVSISILVSSVCMPSSGIAGSYDSYFLYLSIVLSVGKKAGPMVPGENHNAKRYMEPIIQSEVSQKEKHQYSILTHIYGI